MTELDDDVLSDTTHTRYRTSGDTRKTKLSIYLTGQDTWNFIDPESLTWTKYNSLIGYYKVGVDPIGIVTESKTDPGAYVDYVEANQLVIRFQVDGVYVYSKLKSERELNSLRDFEDTEEGIA